MSTRYYLSLVGLLGALLTSCETIVDVPEPSHTPALAVRYSVGTLPAPDSATRALLAGRQLFISASKRLFDQSPIRGLTTATARLLDDGVGGAVVEEFRPGRPYEPYGYYGGDTAGYYVPTRNFEPQPGGTYRLQIEAPGYATVESRLTLPAAPPRILGATFTPRPDDGTGFGNVRGRLTVNLQDDGATTDYYVAFARVLDATGQPAPNGYVYEETNDDGVSDLRGDRLHLSGNSSGNSLTPYADTDINGRAFSLSVDISASAYDRFNGGPMTNLQLEVVISRVTRDAYQFWLSEERYRNVDGNPFAEPAPLYSNIQNGFGLFGGFVDATVRVGL